MCYTSCRCLREQNQIFYAGRHYEGRGWAVRSDNLWHSATKGVFIIINTLVAGWANQGDWNFFRSKKRGSKYVGMRGVRSKKPGGEGHSPEKWRVCAYRGLKLGGFRYWAPATKKGVIWYWSRSVGEKGGHRVLNSYLFRKFKRDCPKWVDFARKRSKFC